MLALTVMACTPAQARGLATPVDLETYAELVDLEPHFQAFIGTPIVARSPARCLDNLENEMLRMVDLRDRYLEVLLTHPRNAYSALALVRVAELHLDLAARARALPAPLDASADEATAFYEITEVYAVPLERAGLSLIEQVDKLGFYEPLAAPWVDRARLYLALHAAADHPSHVRVVRALKRRVALEPRFAPPSTLLDGDRLAPRAARLLP
ncbi:MAG: hypothetical protein ABIJ09_21060 [Pseudomonadota bacterium]